ncbi:serine--tRNA ligase, chloroplastic mitochondrial isoform X1 [Olea europaea subsp. europaea]|uniref:serine--tRNA ligase n=2 Tax=Olea europaea subsp. europaea TaxID=158383 RepID=A0A8S0UBB6_OLEEU|nr:serine--tRNA ligase, chloroplastic mitochondrial isoform X1 [Olea europaea subsp. europaea]
MGLKLCLSSTLKFSPISILRPISQSTKNPLRRSLLLVRALSADAAAGTTTIAPDTTPDDFRVAKAPQWKAAIDFKWIRENKEAVAANVKNRNSNANIDLVVELYDKLMNVQKEVEGLRAERNVVANRMKGKLEPSERQKLVEEGKNLKERLVTLEEDLLNLTDELQQEAQCVPNMTHPDVPVGGEDCSSIRKMVGKASEFSFSVKDHVQLGKDLNIFDFDAAAEVSGSKFYYLKNEAVMLEMGLINWAVSEVMKRGFTPLITPEIVRSSVVEKCGFQPRGTNTQVYSIEGSDQCLIGTAEIPVGGIHMDSIIPESSLPLKYVAFSHCFRTEAGAAGAATRGLYRVHQFSKVEMFILCRPEESNSFHEELIEIEEELFSSLGLHFKYASDFISSGFKFSFDVLTIVFPIHFPLAGLMTSSNFHRTIDMATQDLGAPAYRKFDVEAWMPGLGRYGEISSASNCTDYQSRRLGIRYRPESSIPPKKGKGSSTPTRFVHTLNATACAVPRMIICLLENYQQEDGSVVIPEPLRRFMGGLEIITPKIQIRC